MRLQIADAVNRRKNVDGIFDFVSLFEHGLAEALFTHVFVEVEQCSGTAQTNKTQSSEQEPHMATVRQPLTM